MTPEQADSLIAALERIADALEGVDSALHDVSYELEHTKSGTFAEAIVIALEARA